MDLLKSLRRKGFARNQKAFQCLIGIRINAVALRSFLHIYTLHFDKPSPLAEKVNCSAANGWEYIEVKKNDQWVCLDELREIWSKK